MDPELELELDWEGAEEVVLEEPRVPLPKPIVVWPMVTLWLGMTDWRGMWAAVEVGE